MRVLVRGLNATVTEQMLRDKVAPYAKVDAVEIVRDGDASHPWALLDLAVDPLTCWQIVYRLDRQSVGGCITRWHVPPHQT